MIAVDTNILVYAHRADLEWHAPARARLESLAGEPASWAVPMHCLHEFYATVTRSGLLARPTPPDVALRVRNPLVAVNERRSRYRARRSR